MPHQAMTGASEVAIASENLQAASFSESDGLAQNLASTVTSSPSYATESSCIPSPTDQHLTQSVVDQLSNEILKIIAALYMLKLPTPNANLEHNAYVQGTCPPHLTEQPKALPSTNPSEAPSRFNFPVDMRQSVNTEGPFIRLVTHGKNTLVHLGQLVGILDDHSAFLLQRVVSFDPRRVQLHILADLKPADILALTESKRQQMQSKERRAKAGGLLSQLITTTNGLEAGRRSDRPNELSTEDQYCQYPNPTTRHGPVLTTPGLVLIRADQVRELGIITENSPTDQGVNSWDFCSDSLMAQNTQSVTEAGNKLRKKEIAEDTAVEQPMHEPKDQSTSPESTECTPNHDSLDTFREDLTEANAQATSTAIKKPVARHRTKSTGVASKTRHDSQSQREDGLAVCNDTQKESGGERKRNGRSNRGGQKTMKGRRRQVSGRRNVPRKEVGASTPSQRRPRGPLLNGLQPNSRRGPLAQWNGVTNTYDNAIAAIQVHPTRACEYELHSKRGKQPCREIVASSRTGVRRGRWYQLPVY